VESDARSVITVLLSSFGWSLNGDGFGQIARLIDVVPFLGGKFTSEHL
jgi:hypothetical protein